ncbi:glycosyltransferase family 4 protein [Nitrosomonas sp. Is37]|uniref:glycosyltransferase family 4 protein n=1 Tax=Nitrosomonas sp. Is37 TaxID=3080535 RepID=UPI00294B3D72|nr:glycosyltransferase family 4 protein [Nitrosomonas sp. Is37]MDV6344902.1 glycosyltransferase family 4 protein [Nitrosomonas sp. Is37]
MRILVISPTPSHPQNQGNSARIAVVCRQLQSLGHIIHFLYYTFEGLTDEQREEMSSSWDYFHTLPCDLPNTEKTLGDFYGIDDWYDPRLGEFAEELHRRWNFDMVWVNYVWFSAVLDSLPDTVFKIIDTHDVFGDRHLRFTEIGLEPEWFYTTIDEERFGLARAHQIIAIQDEEEAYFKRILKGTKTQVTTIGHIIPPRLSFRNHMNDKLTIGYLGSGNPFNVSSLKAFADALQSVPEIHQNYRFVLAGTICDKIKELPPFEILGRIDDLDDFYHSVDIVINPMKSGTGLKIKTLEALSYGLPFWGSESSLLGIDIHEKQIPKDETSLLIPLLALNQMKMHYLSEQNSRLTFISYISDQSNNFYRLFK